MICTKCRVSPAVLDPILGFSPYCEECQNKLTAIHTKVPEFAGEKIKESRAMYAQDIEQPHYKGHLNKAWLDVNPKKRIEKAQKMGFSEKEIKNAQYVYSGSDTYYKKYT